MYAITKFSFAIRAVFTLERCLQIKQLYEKETIHEKTL